MEIDLETEGLKNQVIFDTKAFSEASNVANGGQYFFFII